VGGRDVPAPIPADGDLRESIFAALLGATTEAAPTDYPEERFGQRIRLMMADRELRKAHRSSHVSHRRIPIESALRAGTEQGVLLPGLDPEACFDLIAGVFHYQLVLRGDRLEDEDTRARCRAALDVARRGMMPLR
jgi:hypothetical protein